MPLQNLSLTQIKISPIGLGCWQFSGGKQQLAQQNADVLSFPLTSQELTRLCEKSQVVALKSKTRMET